jgi:hypothetical protein
MTMLRYWVFAGATYYPSAAWEDFRGTVDSLADAEVLLTTCVAYGLDWYQIVDSTTGVLVAADLFPHRHVSPFDPQGPIDWQRFLRQSGDPHE